MPARTRRRAVIVTVGDELLSGDTVDTNSAELGRRCRLLGLEVVRAVSVRDREHEIEAALREASEADVCLVSGGLGPTTDDLTTAALARAAGQSLVSDAAELAVIEEKFRSLGRTMADSNRKQAERPEGARWLPNPIGSASGLELELDGCLTFVMPGVPRELRRMMEEQVEPRLRGRFDLDPLPRRVYRTLGMGESSLASRVAAVLAQARTRSPGLAAMFVHYRAAMPEVRLVLEATPDADGNQATPAELAGLDGPLSEVLAPALYGVGEADLAPRLVRALSGAGLRVGFAESCTAGGAAALLASVPGASACLEGGIVAYHNRVKRTRLGVAEEDLLEHGAVSEPVARAMAEGGRAELGTDLCVAITGVAGPDGGTPEKPVGTVHFAVSDANGTDHKRLSLRHNRATIQRSAALWALKLLWDRLVERGEACIEPLD